MKRFLLFSLIICLGQTVNAQGGAESPAELANQSLATLEGPKGEERDWEQWRSYFVEDARMTLVAKPADEDTAFVRHLTLDDFQERAGANYLKNGFYEYEITEPVVREYGDMAVVWQPYAIKFDMEGEEIMRGINVYHMVRMNGRWYISFLTWQAQSESLQVTDWREEQQ